MVDKLAIAAGVAADSAAKTSADKAAAKCHEMFKGHLGEVHADMWEDARKAFSAEAYSERFKDGQAQCYKMCLNTESDFRRK